MPTKSAGTYAPPVTSFSFESANPNLTDRTPRPADSPRPAVCAGQPQMYYHLAVRCR
jgi:hypothetical protein